MEQDGGETDTIVAGPRDFITLAQPRPGTARRQNEYVETPLRPPLPKAVTTQPEKASDLPPPLQHEGGDSIICRQCGRCRCEACRSPRPLPARWLCNNKCLCSAAALADYCSCVCCVRGLFYHWAKDSEMDSDVSCADQPCSCAPHRRLLRWGCLGLLALPLPCLCLYWPLRGCAAAADAGYGRLTARGCRCRTSRLLDAAAPDC